MNILLLLCWKQYLNSFVDELSDWKDEGAQVFLYGITKKASYGFIFVEWGKPIPERFHHKMRTDTGVIDYLTFDTTVPSANATP